MGNTLSNTDEEASSGLPPSRPQDEGVPKRLEFYLDLPTAEQDLRAMEKKPSYDKILILDFGSQYTQLIARRVRECEIYSEIHPYSMTVEEVKAFNPKGILLSGGPASVYQRKAPHCDSAILNLGIPILGICYGMQLMGHLLGGEVIRGKRREYGMATLTLTRSGRLFKGVGQKGSQVKVWMSHGDHVRKLPPGFCGLAESPNTPYTAIEH